MAQAFYCFSRHFWPFLTFFNHAQLNWVNSVNGQGILKSDTILEIIGYEDIWDFFSISIFWWSNILKIASFLHLLSAPSGSG